MDSTHLVLGGLLLVGIMLGIVIPVIGFRVMFKRSEKDEAIDAATFLALRDLREWLQRTRAERSK